MKRFFTLVFILSLLYFSLNPLSKTFATESNPGPAGVPQLEYIFSRIVCVTVPIGYIALMVVLIIAGIKYLVSGGETKAVSSAHQTITWGIMGLLFLAISWLILLLIQNFTGIEVTKFSVSSLPGIQGFSGSCWGEPPVAPMAPKPTPLQLALSGQSSTIKCSKSEDMFRPTTPEEISQSVQVIYTIPDDISELAEVLDKAKLIIFLPKSSDGVIYTFKEKDKSRSFTWAWGKFEKSVSGLDLLEVHKKAKEIRTKLGTAERVIIDGNSVRADFFSNGMIECDDANFFSITTYSPLIYLYNTKIEPVAVKINSPLMSGKIAPDTNGFWNVITFPDGTFTSQDGKKHNFIPYEFIRYDFKKPFKGFVVEEARLEEYLKTDLWKKLGLTNSEINDYWQDTKPRVPAANYYFVSLIERKEINRVLPMEVNPNPDTIIRNMTYILPLTLPFVPQPLEEEKLKSPERKGFSVLENGVFVDGT